MNPVKVTYALLSCIGIYGICGICSYTLTRENIWMYVKDDALLDSVEDEIWIKKEENLRKANKSELEQTLKEIRELLASKGDSKGREIKKWCLSAYNRTYRSSMMIGTDDRLLNNIKDHCIYTIGEKISEDKNFRWIQDASVNDVKDKIDELKVRISSMGSPRTFKVTDYSDSEILDQLKFKCEGLYRKGYQGENSASYKQVQYYCKR